MSNFLENNLSKVTTAADVIKLAIKAQEDQRSQNQRVIAENTAFLEMASVQTKALENALKAMQTHSIDVIKTEIHSERAKIEKAKRTANDTILQNKTIIESIDATLSQLNDALSKVKVNNEG